MADRAGDVRPRARPPEGLALAGCGIANQIPAMSTEARATASTLRNLHLGSFLIPYPRPAKRPPSQRTAKRLFTSDGDSTGDDRAGQRCRQWPRRTLDPEQPSPPPCWWRY